ncbi:hydrogenase maturation protease [Candidatus Bathyarchaeota archaeon]|nr:hydrogenase maturation protease [Candidatus Bathyarchaeota archaeon]
MRTLVIGVGNLIRCDDGAGVHVVNRLTEKAPHIDTLDVALGSIEILEVMKGYGRVYIVDAIQTGAEPGTVFRVNLIEREEPPTVTHSHGVDLVTTIELGKRLFPDEMPGEVFIIGIEAEDIITLSEHCTERVAGAVETVVDYIISMDGGDMPR